MFFSKIVFCAHSVGTRQTDRMQSIHKRNNERYESYMKKYPAPDINFNKENCNYPEQGSETVGWCPAKLFETSWQTLDLKFNLFCTRQHYLKR